MEKFKEGAALGFINTLIAGGVLAIYIVSNPEYELSDQFKLSNEGQQMSKIEKSIDEPAFKSKEFSNQNFQNYFSSIWSFSGESDSSNYAIDKLNSSLYKGIPVEKNQKNKDTSQYIFTSNNE